ncbi:MAG: hypothetical protein ACN6NY_09660 [Acinetobacter faecalis]|uniref:Signal pepetide n=1 Tax=Acinetobacter faecalis TaxID=2665161 RepID=A0AB35UYL0_9GAMM|nr:MULTISPECIES: hypothetical protein [Acinetobacter]MDY6487543.1 hypothetical protein [Acinetobacter faecalis]MDY6489168.1 hypothetical protein [Acinetobacter faecalis]MDY6511283.1 hypothetical protein [Acinetobacter faecalis]MDY6530181.1 hypothetical protein [Acinetobacter faecalis]MDY6551019.1 hypothetical protein [Acinetobacter faecalis]
MTDSLFWIKSFICCGIIFLFAIAILLWLKTPQLFEYFNQAFCPH